MNKAELVNAVSEKSGLGKAESMKAVDAFIDIISEALKAGDKVTLLGFGTFSVAEKAARKGFNPRTKEKIEIPAHKVAKFKPGSALNLD